ncbi:hypothetical protein M075_2315, partial [Bacteroides fragilis str. 20793-3]
MDSSGESWDTCFFVNYKRGPVLFPFFHNLTV